jgi:hypothetical protein
MVVAFLAVAGCSRQPKAASQLEELERAFQAGGSAPEMTSPEVPAETPAGQTESAQAYVSRAVAAVRKNQPAEGVMLLQSAQQATTLNAEQRMAIQRSIRALTAGLVARASRGDQQAQAELKRIEQFLSTR